MKVVVKVETRNGFEFVRAIVKNGVVTSACVVTGPLKGVISPSKQLETKILDEYTYIKNGGAPEYSLDWA